MQNMVPLYIDSDNAIEARRGDVDDAFAIVAMLLAGLPVAAIGAVSGNTSARRAIESNRATARVCSFAGPLLEGREPGDAASSEASRWLADRREQLRIIALGPLTNVARALRLDRTLERRIEELVLVGGNRASRGRWPPLWPWEFNLWRDREAAREVFASQIPLTIVPLDVAKRLRASGADLEMLPGPIGSWLRVRAGRWLRRAKLIKLRDWFPVWDLAAAMLVVDRARFRVDRLPVAIDARCHVTFGAGPREADVVAGFDREELWSAFAALVDR